MNTNIKLRLLQSPSRAGFGALPLVGAVLGLAVLLLVGIVVFRSVTGSGLEPLPESALANSPKNFSGNRYLLEARIDRQLGFEEEVGRMILVASVASGVPIPLFVPAKMDTFSPSPGQVYRFALRVDGEGVLNVENYTKR